MDILMMNNVGLTYQSEEHETVALDNIDFRVKSGDFVAIVGPSGCGKTTILSLISGLICPSKGDVFIQGKKISGVSDSIGYMLQRDQLFEWRTVFENVMLGLEIKKRKNPENVDYAKNLLKKYGLYEFSHHYPRQISGGMRQRVALIRTLVLKPDLLLLDEPFSALDFQTRLSVCDDVYSIIKSENKTAILVTHDISEAVSMADKIIVLTKRPATINKVFEVDLKEKTPLLRRKESKFSYWFDSVWREIP